MLCFWFYRKGKGEDVLNDIDSMLQGLTDELDAMLEEELQIQEWMCVISQIVK